MFPNGMISDCGSISFSWCNRCGEALLCSFQFDWRDVKESRYVLNNCSRWNHKPTFPFADLGISNTNCRRHVLLTQFAL